MNRVRLAAAMSALLLLAACGAGPVSDAADGSLQRLSGRSTSVNGSTAPQTTTESGLSVTVSAPKVFTPTDAASPRAPRAVAFDLMIDNEGTTIYRPSQLSVTATCDGATAIQVIDSTQGYTGIVSATEEVPPGHTVRVSVAFAVPALATAFQLVVQPDAMTGNRLTLFQGTV